MNLPRTSDKVRSKVFTVIPKSMYLIKLVLWSSLSCLKKYYVPVYYIKRLIPL